MKKYAIILLTLIALHSAAQQVTVSKKIQQAMNRIDTNTIRSHIAYLADDKLKPIIGIDRTNVTDNKVNTVGVTSHEGVQRTLQYAIGYGAMCRRY